nr:receptor-type tyrosine-protein phosphatase F-like isoform X1 [Nomia melanderi]XP_031832322.1 receptor-type tyrosine-protein phosphatase F-like isoform X1 [Nomia melanderi]XP_031832323.1 receptor-type tyrosine-protein phosphatase F-like isoform X1 [Nomia melanderi]XP_031832325.1 receptor-type tyrosine-protein phosphatase F-like isoform X1 [Nomia melanderi]XP_031832326.1 receptor-type tyrosine-protein phosphatase F-like isoform X1 [Nomia melanderi]XP_031832327.1 receptor-type tyrosine-protein
MSVLEILLLTIQFSVTNGRLTVLGGPLWEERKLICVSENDGSSLVWNYDITPQTNAPSFLQAPNYLKNVIDCDLNIRNECFSNWGTDGWNLTSSMETPMGPVCDYRWEGFKEFMSLGYTYSSIDKLRGSKSFAVSIRGSNDGYILLCEGEKYTTDFCYWIIISGWNNMRSTIRKCANGVSEPNMYSSDDSCKMNRLEYSKKSLSQFEWRTFVVTWNKNTRNISVYDDNNLILTYVDNETRREEQLPKTDTNHSIFLASKIPMLFRLHLYDFLYTTDRNAVLRSPELLCNTNLCVEMAIGLCAECKLELILVNRSTEEESLEVIKGSTVAGAHGLPTWQYARINKTISSNLGKRVTIKMVPQLDRETPKPLWAVANVRMCPPIGSTRKSTYFKPKSDWQHIACQKLFYNESIVVSPMPRVTPDLDFGDSKCPEGKVGPYCSIDCQLDLQLSSDCYRAVICEKSGCTCPPGYIDEYCSRKCDFPYYGQNCNYTCGQCNNDACNFRTGICEQGCKDSEGNRIEPFCDKVINVPPLLNITFLNATSVRVVVPEKNEYKLINPYIFFTIKEEGKIYSHSIEAVSNGTHIIGIIDSLKPGVSYQVACNFRINTIYKHGKWNNFTTLCSASKNFEVELKSRSLTLKTINQQFDSCPTKWYNFVIENPKLNTVFYNASLDSLPYKFHSLQPYTIYKITINRGPNTYFSRKVRTLDAAPSKVRNIALVRTSNSVTLTWMSPKNKNGIIKRYEIVLKVESYIGCLDLKKDFPKKEIRRSTLSCNITIAELAPHVTYVAKIAACTSECGSEIEKKFTTEAAEIPSEIYSELRIEDFVLHWNPPEDCTTISGTMYTRLLFRGLSKSVANNTYDKQTSGYSIDLRTFLHGAEEYEVSVYATRDFHKKYNASAFQRISFITPPKAPPPVTELGIYEVNNENKGLILHLRWKEPEPPTNGKIEHYVVLQNHNKYETPLQTVLPTEYCPFWVKYICATIELSHKWKTKQIQVAAQNENVPDKGIRTSVNVITSEFLPDMPNSFDVKALAQGVVNVTWSHPWRTGGQLRRFLIFTETISTCLKSAKLKEKSPYEYPVLKYQALYNKQFHLMPSTAYNIKIIVETIAGAKSSEMSKQVKTPSATGFKNDPTVETGTEDSTVLLHIPAIVNDTKNSVMHVVVIGSKPCDHSAKATPVRSEKTNITFIEIAWRVATFPTDKFAGRTFTVGDNKLYEGAINCPLKRQEFYTIAVVLQLEEGPMSGEIKVAKTPSFYIGELPKGHIKVWLIPIVICLIVAAIGYYLYQRKTKVPSTNVVLQEGMASARNSVIPENNELSNVNRILAVTPDTFHKERLSHFNTPHNSPLAHDAREDGSKVKPPVEVKNFEDYVKQAIDSGLLDKQFNTLPRGQTKPWDYGKLPQNKSKNRYGNLIAYDENRVILETLPEDPHSDYINANYIKGYNKEKYYIATQGPKPNTVNDFWRMVWQEQTTVICMLANVVENGKTKCEQYWPDIGKKKKYGELVVFNAKHTVFADYTFRTLHLKQGMEMRKIEHLHYTAWPDHGVPLSTHSVVTYLKKLLAMSPRNGPVVVHCSAGIGRTGTIILCDICLRRAIAEGVIDVFRETQSIRSQRANMVDTKQQYLFAHLTLVEYLFPVPTCLPCDEALPMQIEELKKQLAIQQQSLEKAMWQDEALKPATSKMSLSMRNLAKMRFPKLTSANTNRVYLTRYPPTDDDSDYISAIYVDGVKLQNQYIATQLPMPGTLSDFWRMVDEYKVELIVELQPPDPDDTTCCSIAPSKEFKPVPYISIKAEECTEYEYYTLQKLTLDNEMARPPTEQQVIIIRSTEWKAGRNQAPPSMIALITLWQATERIVRGRELTIVMCYDGVTGCGLYLAMSLLLERMSVERECDVCLAIRAVRRSNHDFVRTLEQMEYLYDAANAYLKYFETYANFT